MHVFHSNRLELLAAKLACLIRDDPSDPCTAERIVVPHQATGQWLKLEIARELGIVANVSFELPAEFAWSILRQAVPSLSKAQGFDPANLRWHLFELLPEFARQPGSDAVRTFLADGDERKKFELADRLARVFDRCINFRPDWIGGWQQDSGSGPWQARLWRLLASKVEEQHWVDALAAFQRETADGSDPQDWPRRVFFYNVAALSPSYLQWLGELGKIIDLHVFHFSPSEEYWGDIHTERASRTRARGGDPGQLHFEEGNKLLAAWGRGGQDTFDALVELGDGHQHFPRTSGTSRLAAVQEDIQLLRSAADAAAVDAVPPDSSLQIHCCHSAMREVEVLHDRLLDVLESNPAIEAADIMIVTPDLAAYGPMIAAVFEAEGRIPLSLSRFRAVGSPTVRAFLDLLALPGSRYGVEAVLAPLAAPALRARFGIGESSLPSLRAWLRKAGIRRAIDTRAESGNSACGDAEHMAKVPGHSWREGLHRLLMGYATGDVGALVLGVAPCVIHGEAGLDAGENDYERLGRFISYCENAFCLPWRFAGERSARQWAKDLSDTLATFFDDGASISRYADFEAARQAAEEITEARELIGDFARQAGRTGCPIPFAVVRQALREAASSPALGPARLADGVAVGRLAPGQILPAKVVCAVGMNGTTFPRKMPRHSFDLVATSKRRRGDRDTRDDDRFAFLEALLAARSSFLVTYTGRNQRDDMEIPPSVVVDELIDYLDARFPATDLQSGQSAADSITIKHPLQPFSSRYFGNSPQWFSYSERMLAAAQAVRDADEAHRANRSRSTGRCKASRFHHVLPEPDDSRREVTLAELERFFANPAAGFLRDRLGFRLEKVPKPSMRPNPCRSMVLTSTACARTCCGISPLAARPASSGSSRRCWRAAICPTAVSATRLSTSLAPK